MQNMMMPSRYGHAGAEGFEGAREQVSGDAGDDDQQREYGHRDASDPGLGGEGGVDRDRVSAGLLGGLWGFGCLKHPNMVPLGSAPEPVRDRCAGEYVRFIAAPPARTLGG